MWRLLMISEDYWWLKNMQMSLVCVQSNSKKAGTENFLLGMWILIHKYLFCLCSRCKQFQICADGHFVLIHKLWQEICFGLQKVNLLYSNCELRCLQITVNKKCLQTVFCYLVGIELNGKASFSYLVLQWYQCTFAQVPVSMP